jgi:hypothetical protein
VSERVLELVPEPAEAGVAVAAALVDALEPEREAVAELLAEAVGHVAVAPGMVKHVAAEFVASLAGSVQPVVQATVGLV